MHSTFLGHWTMKTRRNSTYVPLSTISPSWRTRIWLACMMVESLWATIIVVRFSHTFAREAWMFLSVCVSNAEVAYTDVIKQFKRKESSFSLFRKSANYSYFANQSWNELDWNSETEITRQTSSSNTNSGDLRIVLAIATLCFSPPLNFSPRSPTFVLYPVFRNEKHASIKTCTHFSFTVLPSGCYIHFTVRFDCRSFNPEGHSLHEILFVFSSSIRKHYFWYFDTMFKC